MDIVEPQWPETVSLIKPAVMDILEPQRPRAEASSIPTATKSASCTHRKLAKSGGLDATSKTIRRSQKKTTNFANGCDGGSGRRQILSNSIQELFTMISVWDVEEGALSGRHVGIESDCRGRSGTIVNNEARKKIIK